MASSININQNNNDVTLQDNNGGLSITNNNTGTTINVTQPVTNVVTVATVGPQGPVGPIQTSGSFNGSFSGSFTGSLQGTASNAISASYAFSSTSASYSSTATSASYALSASFTSTASYVQNAQTASYVLQAVSASYALSASYSQTASYVTLAQTASYVLQAVSASFATNAQNAQTASYVLNAVSASYAVTSSYSVSSSYALNATSASNALTASYLNTLNQDLTFNGNLTVNGTASISTLVVNQTVLSTGSNQLGDAANDTQTLYGTVVIPTGSLTVTGSVRATGGFTGSFSGSVVAPGLDTQIVYNRNGILSADGGFIYTGSFPNNFVGINSPTPLYSLDVNGAIYQRTGELLITTSGSVNKEGPFIASSGGTNRTTQLGILDNSVVPVGIDMFETNNSFPSSYLNFRVNNADLVRMTGSFVGIGTNTPTAPLHVSSSANTGLIVQTPNPSIQLIDAFNPWFLQGVSNDRFRITRGGGVDLFTLKTNGNVGINLGTTAPAAMLNVKGSGATSSTTALRIENTNSSASLVVLDNGYVGIGTGSAAFNLDVNGTTRITGTGTTSATTALTITNSSGATYLQARNDGSLIGTTLATTVGAIWGLASYIAFQGRTLALTGNGGGGSDFLSNSFIYSTNASFSATINFSRFNNSFIHNGTGDQVANFVTIDPTINQTGGAPGITRGLFISPTLTAAADWRSIEWSNNTGFGLYGAGGATNYLSGSLGIGTTTPTASLHISGASSTNLLRIDSPASSSILFVSGSGNIGIGTPAVANQLLTVGTSTSQPAFFNNILYINAPSYLVSKTIYSGTGRNIFPNSIETPAIVVGTTTANAVGTLHVRGSGATSATTTFRTENTSASPSLTITDDLNSRFFGNVGIQRAATSSLDIAGTTRISGSFNTATSGSILTVIGSGSAQPIFTVQGSQGELFSITDSLSGSLFSVNDISGLPILEVFSDNTTLIGNYQDPMLITTAKVVQTNSGSFTVYSLPTASYDTAFFEYSIKSGSNARAGTIMAIQLGSTVNFTETTTTDFGNTSAVSFTVIVTGSNMALTGSSTTGSWTTKCIVRGI